MTRNRLYLLTGTLLSAGYAYMAWSANHHDAGGTTLCVFKNTTGIPCPSCGSTRAVTELLHGNVLKAAYINPLGFIIAALMLLLPLWLVYDLSLKKQTYYNSYQLAEKILQTKWVAAIFIILITSNWIWNIKKGL